MADGQRPWRIPWNGGTGVLSVHRSPFERLVAIQVDGQEVGRVKKSSLEDPWVEFTLSANVVVAQLQLGQYEHKMLAFIDGRSVEDGRPYDDWRRIQPVSLDQFEQRFRGRIWGLPGALLIGTVAALPPLRAYGQTRNQVLLPLALAAFVIPAGWVLATAALSRWLRTKRSWDAGVRTALVLGLLLGLPLFALAYAQAWGVWK